MRVLVTGSNGQVGVELQRAVWPQGTQVVAMDRDDLDIRDPGAVRATVLDGGFDVVINAAAYTAVDKAESERDLCFAVNADGPENLASACVEAGIPLLHISTDYVFDGSKDGWYREDDPVAPLGAYGESKADGEARVREVLDRHVILRTAWVYAAHGHNFVKTMLRFGAERDEMRVVDDQRGCPTCAADIAQALAAIAVRAHKGDAAWGTYHYCGADDTTWHGFADEIFRLQEEATGRRPRLSAITTADYPTPARRPANSRLDCGAIRKAFGIEPVAWREALRPVVTSLLRQQERSAR